MRERLKHNLDALQPSSVQEHGSDAAADDFFTNMAAFCSTVPGAEPREFDYLLVNSHVRFRITPELVRRALLRVPEVVRDQRRVLFEETTPKMLDRLDQELGAGVTQDTPFPDDERRAAEDRVARQLSLQKIAQQPDGIDAVLELNNLVMDAPNYEPENASYQRAMLKYQSNYGTFPGEEQDEKALEVQNQSMEILINSEMTNNKPPSAHTLARWLESQAKQKETWTNTSFMMHIYHTVRNMDGERIADMWWNAHSNGPRTRPDNLPNRSFVKLIETCVVAIATEIANEPECTDEIRRAVGDIILMFRAWEPQYIEDEPDGPHRPPDAIGDPSDKTQDGFGFSSPTSKGGSKLRIREVKTR